MIVLLGSDVVSIHIVRILMTISPKESLDEQSSLCSVCFFSVAFFGNFRVSGPDTEHESVFLFVPDPCMQLAVKRETKKKKRVPLEGESGTHPVLNSKKTTRTA